MEVVDQLAVLTAAHVVTDVGRSLREGLYMLWETLWALIFGFTLSGAVQAFVSRDEMQRRLGDHRPASVARASLYGMASSSCSYAASALARSLVARGADFLASMVFLFASTNLVVELGIVLLVLIGWQLLAAEFVGGAVMIVLLVALGGLWLRGRALEEAGRRVRAAAAGHDAHCQEANDGHDGHDGHDGLEGHDGHEGHGHQEHGHGAPPWRERLRSRAGWADAAGYTIGDLTMLRRELVVGFTVAGFLSTLVPAHLWKDLFLHGHGAWTTLENAVVGPFVAIVSFVCSIGNVPLAAALWKGGISFGGVVSFVFADLISFPLLLVYRRQYGGRMALRMLGVFWTVMSAAGLITQLVFDALGWIPSSRAHVLSGQHFRLDYTTVLDLVALGVLAVVYRLYRSRERLDRTTGYAIDPVCSMQVEVAHAAASTVHAGQQYWFCSDGCRQRFEGDPDRYRSSSLSA